MYRFRSIKYLAMTGIITGLLVTIGYCSTFLFGWAITSLFGGNSTLQLFDAVFIPLLCFFWRANAVICRTNWGGIFDLISGVKIVVIPITIFIRILMFFVIKLLINKYWWSTVYTFFFAAILLFIYPLSYLVIYQDYAITVNELITDSIQAIFAYFVAIPLYYALSKNKIRSNYSFWNDQEFDYLKNKKITVLE
ncbi:hypothetical protein [Spiroplasma endosymbiont of Tiphia femorata]|uniref:hypothetical protein n=1 Tax=Spiroplasma endosymbiont of Tiphia femorata TaxID=3066326 RepID=UPI0030D222A1